MDKEFYHNLGWYDGTSDTRPLEKCTYKELIEMLSLHWSLRPGSHLNVRQRALAELVQYHSNPSIAQNPIQAGAEIIIIGESVFNSDELAKRLEPLDIRVTKKMTASTSHVLLGTNPKTTKGLENRTITLVSDQDFQKELDRIEKPYLKEQDQETQSSVEHLGNLLMSAQDDNVQLAIQIIEGGGFPKELVSHAFIALKETSNKQIYQSLKMILGKYVSVGAKRSIQRTLLFHKNLNETELETNLLKYTYRVPDLNAIEIAQLMLKHHQKCIQFLFLHSQDRAIVRQIIAARITGNVLDLEDLGLKKLPDEILEFKQVDRILLAWNAFTMVPTILAKMDNISYLDLSNNWLNALNATLQNMKNLRYLSLCYPLYGDTDFNRLLKLKQLEELELQDNRFTPEMKETLKATLPNCKITFH